MRGPLDSRMTASFHGFGNSIQAEGYSVAIHHLDELAEVFELARRSGRRIVLRGLGRSYGDAALASEQIIVNMTPLNAVIDFDPSTGIIQAEAGLSLGDLWRFALPQGWWPPVVTGTQHITLAGAIAMNVHGKNQFSSGALINHLVELEVMRTSGELVRVRPQDSAWPALVGGAGLVGVIVSATLQLASVGGGVVETTPFVARKWQEQFDIFAHESSEADYLVGWIDAFSNGRGIVHRADYRPGQNGFQPNGQSKVSRLAVPILRLSNRRWAMRGINAIKYAAGLRERRKLQSLPDYSFLLDAVPDWPRAYGQTGFLQFQPFVPRAAAPELFPKLIQLQQEAKRENYLTVLKQHRPDAGLLSPYLDGFSLAMDFPLTTDSEPLLRLLHQMVELVISDGGRFYLAKDQILTADEFQRSLPHGNLDQFRAEAAKFDPGGLLTSALAQRLAIR